MKLFIRLIISIFSIGSLQAQYDMEAFWSDDSGVYYYNPEVDESKLIVPTLPKVSGGVEVTNDKIYYLSHSSFHINFADSDGGNQTLLFDLNNLDGFEFNLEINYQEITDIVYDPESGFGYFAAYLHAVNTFGNVSYSRSVVYSINLNTSEVDSLFASLPFEEDDDFGYIASLELDRNNNRLFYLVDDGGFVSSRVESRALNGSDLDIVADGFNNPTQIEIDDQSENMFIMTGRGGGKDAVYKAALDGSNWTTLFEDNIKGDNGFILEETQSNLYFHDTSENLLRSDLNGSGVTNNVLAINSMPDAIDIVNKQIYYGNTFTVLTRHTYADENFENYSIDQIIREFQNLTDLQIDPVNDRIFYRLSSFGAIRSMDYDGGNDKLEYAVSSLEIVLKDWKLDPDDQRLVTLEKDETPGVNTHDIYVRTLGNTANGVLVEGNVGSANLIDIDPIGDTYVVFPSNVVGSEAVFDFKNDKAYYIISSGGDYSIYISDSPNDQGEELSFFNVNNAQNLVLSTSEDKIYWSNKSGSIGQFRMDLDGTGEEKISDHPIITLAFVSTTDTENSIPVVENQTFSVDENSNSGTVIGQIIASDDDGDELSFSILSGNTNDAFTLSTTGELTVLNSNALDFETTPTFELDVQVDDGNGGSASATITVNLNDVDESTNNNPSIENQTFSVDENSTSGTTIGQIIASDDDGDELSFSILSGNTNDAFALSTTGELTVLNSNPLDFETTPAFELGVQVEDGNGGSASATITVNLDDVDETDPLGIEDENKLVIYPNPAKRTVTLETTHLKGKSGVLADFSGKVIQKIIFEENMTHLDLDGLLPGTYLLIIGEHSHKITKVE